VTRRAAATPESDQKARYLETLGRVGTLTAGCRAAKCSPHTVYKWRDEDPEFVAQETEIRSAFADSLEEEAFRRAYTGVVKPIYQGGKLVGDVTEYDTTLLVLLLKAVRPEKYRERTQQDVNVKGDLGLQIVYAPQMGSIPVSGE
jgi:hypothetical protein